VTRSRLAAGAVALAIVGAVTVWVVSGPKQAKEGAPNFIVIMTDDQAMNSWSPEVMPRTFERMVDGGTDFSRSFAVPPLCCPARASFITGRYPHNHGVLQEDYALLEDKDDVLPVWLSDAGYQTMFGGKFLNRYEFFEGTRNGAEPAPGWDRWWGAIGRSKFFDYDISRDGEKVEYGSEPEDYLTNALTDESIDFIRESSDSGDPFLLWMSVFAPHFAPRDEGGACPGSAPEVLPEDYEAAADAELPRDPSFDEADVSDKPAVISGLARISPRTEKRLEVTYRCTVASLLAVDRNVERIFQALEESGELDNTVVFYTSDNGFFFGEHRKAQQKTLAYDASLRVPLAVTAPADALGASQAGEVSAPVGTHDLAPTILELAGLEDEHRMDGRSLVAALRGGDAGLPADRALAIEIGLPKKENCNGYRALRSESRLYVESQSQPTSEGADCGVGFQELYDLRDDPFMLENLLAADPFAAEPGGEAQRLASRLRELGTCSGIEGRDERESGRPFCE
jgi:arylsulfatase A-like enzyme